MFFFNKLINFLCIIYSLYMKSIKFFKNIVIRLITWLLNLAGKLNKHVFRRLFYGKFSGFYLYFSSIDYVYYWNVYKYINGVKNTTFLKLRVYYTQNYFTNFFKNLMDVYFLRIFVNRWLKDFSLFSNTDFLRLRFIDITRRSFSYGFIYVVGFSTILFIDACITDDEPLWEPIEWSLVQSWILFIFIFSWIAENLIVSRYGSYTGRDKRVWMSWYKTFWMIEGFYILNYGIVCVFVIVPFYYETNYNLSFVYSWWHWYTRVFFFKFISIYTIVLSISNILQISIRWVNWKKSLLLIAIVNIFLSYLLYTHFVITFFGYFTDPIWYQRVRPIDYIQLSHEPAKWGWGSAKKDHFTYHNVKTVFWFKNDGPFASSFLLFHLFLFVCLFLTYFWWVSLFRKVFATKEVPLTYLIYCISSLRQFFYFFLWMYIFVLLSYISSYWRFPVDMSFMLNNRSWLENFIDIILDYPFFIISIFLN